MTISSGRQGTPERSSLINLSRRRNERIAGIVLEGGSSDGDETMCRVDQIASNFPEDVKIICGFTLSVTIIINMQEFDQLYSMVDMALAASRVGKGRKPAVGPRDSLFLLLSFLTNYPTFRMLGVEYGQKASTIQENIMKTAKLVRPIFMERLVVPVKKKMQVEQGNNYSDALGIAFEDYPDVALVVDCTFQPILVPCAEFLAKRAYFSGKHFQYGVKRETAHIPNGSCVFVSDMFPGSVHDFTIFLRQLPVYQAFLRKEEGERGNLDQGSRPNSWSIMADKGYTGADRHCNAVLPWRVNRRGEQITQASLRTRNTSIARNRIICENFYGRMKTIFAITGDKFRGSLSEFTLFNDIAIALTNFHISRRPLRRFDLDQFRRLTSQPTVSLLYWTNY